MEELDREGGAALKQSSGHTWPLRSRTHSSCGTYARPVQVLAYQYFSMNRERAHYRGKSTSERTPLALRSESSKHTCPYLIQELKSNQSQSIQSINP